MAESNKTTVIDFSDNPKNAALFFDYVIPYSINFLHNEITGNKPWITVLPLLMQSEDPRLAYLELMASMVSPPFMDNNVVGEAIRENVRNIGGKYNGNFESFLKGYNIENYIFLFDSSNNNLCTESYDCTSIELAQLPIIDTTNAQWEQIIEIREDEKSIAKLRNLKLFFNENYSGKEKNYVEDDLCKRLEDYENVTKDWGFDTITSSIQMILTSPVTLTSVGSSLTMALFGQPLKALATAGTGAVIEIGKMSLHIAKEKKKLSILQRDHPLAYIIDAKKKLEK
ncbi:MAG: hypothetical protein FVQ82_09670 [Planctomycetes bacterium]|nr:hypothetical protein [Planctomycetota bacterium]